MCCHYCVAFGYLIDQGIAGSKDRPIYLLTKSRCLTSFPCLLQLLLLLYQLCRLVRMESNNPLLFRFSIPLPLLFPRCASTFHHASPFDTTRAVSFDLPHQQARQTWPILTLMLLMATAAAKTSTPGATPPAPTVAASASSTVRATASTPSATEVTATTPARHSTATSNTTHLKVSGLAKTWVSATSRSDFTKLLPSYSWNMYCMYCMYDACVFVFVSINHLKSHLG